LKGTIKGFIKTVVAVLVLAIPLSACSAGSGTNSSSSSKAKAPAQLVMGFYRNVDTPQDMQAVIDQVNKILIKNDNCEISKLVSLNYGNYLDQLNLMLSSNEHLDVFLCKNSSNFINYVSRGQVISMDDLMTKYGAGIISAVGEEFLAAGVVNGHQYGITTNRDLAKSYGFVMLKSVVDKYKIDYKNIKSMDDMVKVFQTVKENEPTMAPWVASSGPNVLLEWLCNVDQLSDDLGVLMNNGQDDKLQVVNMFDTTTYEKWVRYMYDLYQKGYIEKDILTTKDTPQSLMKANTGFAESTGLKPGIDVQEGAVVSQPVVNVTVASPVTSSTIVQTVQWCIAKNSTEPDASMKLLAEMYTNPKVANLFAWGIEGKDYVVGKDGLIDYPEGVTSKTVGYNLNLGWAFGNQYLTHIWEGNSPTLWSDMDNFNKSATKSRAFGFVYDPSNVKSEVAACTNVLNQYRTGLEFGALNPDTSLPEFRQKLKDAGIDKIVKEKQKQLDAWVASNTK
jgi:putative aldouronate transport system substrate-binding protein